MPRQTPLLPEKAPGTRLGLVAVTIACIGMACAPRPAPPPPGIFLEEFEGFPIYHGPPERAYKVLGPVYDEGAAERGISPMKRAAVKRAGELGADAILLGESIEDVAQRPPPEAADTEGRRKWRGAVAISWE